MFKKLLFSLLIVIGFNTAYPFKMPKASTVVKKASTATIIAGGIGLVACGYFAPQVTLQVGQEAIMGLGSMLFGLVKGVGLAVPSFCTGAYGIIGNGLVNMDSIQQAEFIKASGMVVVSGLGIKYLLNKAQEIIDWLHKNKKKTTNSSPVTTEVRVQHTYQRNI